MKRRNPPFFNDFQRVWVFKSHLPHLTLGKPCKSQIYRAFLYFNFTMYSFFTRKSVLKFSERLTSIRKEYFHENCHVRSEIQASQTCAYLNWVILERV